MLNYMNQVWNQTKLFNMKQVLVNIYGEENVIDLPSRISVKKACVNVSNDDNKCFEYSVKCGWYDLHTETNPQRISYYKDDNF